MKNIISEYWQDAIMDYDKYDVVCELTIGNACNYNCVYCFNDDKHCTNDVREYSIEELKKAFDNSGYRWLIRFRYGEPFCTSEFINLCKALTEFHYISMNSNLFSDQVYKFADEIDPSRVMEFKGSYHLGEVNRFNKHQDFIEKAHYLMQKNFQFCSTMVFYPPYIDEIIECLKDFDKERIPYFGRIFRGNFNGKIFPMGYSPEERTKIYKFLDAADKFILDKGDSSFFGKPCLAGKRFVNITKEGNVKRCLSVASSQGNIFKGFHLNSKSVPCPSQKCECFYFGYALTGKASPMSYMVAVSQSVPILFKKLVTKIFRLI